MTANGEGRGYWPWLLAGPLAGTLLGVVDSVVNHVPEMLGEVATARAERSGWAQASEFASLILDAGWAWAATAVLAGWLTSRRLRGGNGVVRGAVAGVLALVFATAIYYGTDVLFDGDRWWGVATRYWLIGSVLFGPALGAAGALIRRRGWVGALAGLVVPIGAAVQMVELPPPPDSLMREPVRLTVFAGAAMATLLVIRRNTAARPAVTAETNEPEKTAAAGGNPPGAAYQPRNRR